MNKPMSWDSRYTVSDGEIIHRYDEGTSLDALVRLVMSRNAIKQREARGIVERAILARES